MNGLLAIERPGDTRSGESYLDVSSSGVIGTD